MRLTLLILLVGLWLASPPAHAAPGAPVQMGTTSEPQKTYIFKWYSLIYTEAFRRLGLQVELSAFPTQRLVALMERGVIDGEAGRARIYGEAHPEFIRVEESVFDVEFALYTAKPQLTASKLDDLRGQRLTAGYRRGVLYCERELNSVLPAAQIVDVTQEEQGLQMLQAGRIDVFCGLDPAVRSTLDMPSLRGTTTVRKLMTLQASALYPYLHRKQAEHAAPLAAAMKAMKTEGLIEHYRLQAIREFGR